jgi:CheY-like chemotaxis protein
MAAQILHHNEGSKHVLIVEDDISTLSVYEMALSDLGFVPVTASGGDEAIEKVREFKPSLILVDYRMPGMNGLEFVRRAREICGNHIPIVMASAGRNFETEALSAGVSVCVEKPFDVGEFIEVIKSFTGSPEAISA